MFFLCGDNLDLFWSEAEKFEAVRSCGPNVLAVLSDTAGEDEKVNTAEESNICTDYLAYGNRKDIQRKSGASVVRAGPLFQRLHITLAGGECEEAALMVEQIFKFVGAELLIPYKVEDDARIKIAGASTHRDAARGGQAHRGVDRYSVAKSAEAGSITQMREDGSFGNLRTEMMHERLVRETVETIASNPAVEIALREG